MMRGTEQHFVAGLNGLVTDPNGQVGVAHARRSDKDKIVAIVDKPEVQQGVRSPLANRGLVAIVEGLQVLLRWEAGLA